MSLLETHQLRTFALVVASAVALVGCLAVGVVRAADDGPVGLVDDTARTCLVAARAGEFTATGTVVTTASEEPVEVTDVRIGDAESLELRAAYLVPVLSGNVLASDTRWPPSAELTAATGGDWERRMEAVGLGRLEPATSRTWSLVLRVRSTDERARFRSVEVDYRLGTRTFTTSGDVRWRTAPSC